MSESSVADGAGMASRHAVLHILNKPPGHARTHLCLATLAATDALVLIEDAVLALASGLDTSAAVYALGPDLAARGLAADNGQTGVIVIDYEELVALAAGADKTVSW
ncbi:sulfurtransferase complex subunit TusB [Marinobacter xestospongiae]|uniref:sulfurtransferase complex subunit TusB n=1 Tax=Marinobacter xestospongiae TaxID=994319 RepID=UPI0020061346|nr:sulfurtransferase complex subunit TusB [Marinobacter xestospongiae]MCK7566208.1 sulfurtransferase complex subunit TusB [Marinobacter xestospongiae]